MGCPKLPMGLVRCGGFALIVADAADTVGHVANELVNLSSLTSQLTY